MSALAESWRMLTADYRGYNTLGAIMGFRSKISRRRRLVRPPWLVRKVPIAGVYEEGNRQPLTYSRDRAERNCSNRQMIAPT